MLISSACRYEETLQDWYVKWTTALGLEPVVRADSHLCHRKNWEWASIVQTLYERKMLQPGKRGMVFAVGSEKLPALFASRGVEIFASDGPASVVEEHWASTGQFAPNLDSLYFSDYLSRNEFDRLVSFAPVDMNSFENLADEQFDFIWSSCAMEHLGSLEAGTTFVKNAMRLIKPGGIAVHTTEYNCSSNDETLSAGWNVLYRRNDLERLSDELRILGCGMEVLDFNLGTHPLDLDFDIEPYFVSKSPHLKIQIDAYVSTSIRMIIRKAG